MARARRSLRHGPSARFQSAWHALACFLFSAGIASRSNPNPSPAGGAADDGLALPMNPTPAATRGRAPKREDAASWSKATLRPCGKIFARHARSDRHGWMSSLQPGDVLPLMVAQLSYRGDPRAGDASRPHAPIPVQPPRMKARAGGTARREARFESSGHLRTLTEDASRLKPRVGFVARRRVRRKGRWSDDCRVWR